MFKLGYDHTYGDVYEQDPHKLINFRALYMLEIWTLEEEEDSEVIRD